MLKIKFINRNEFAALPGVVAESVKDSSQTRSDHHVNGKTMQKKMHGFTDYAYATGVKDCVSVALIPDNKEKKAKLLHLNAAMFLENLDAIDRFIRLDLDDEDLKNSSSVVLGSLGEVKDFGDGYNKTIKVSQALLKKVLKILSDTGTKISQFTHQKGTFIPAPAIAESHIYVDRPNSVVYIYADHLNLPLDKNGNIEIGENGIDKSKLVPQGGITSENELSRFFGVIEQNHSLEFIG